jgi:hypothetical protein
MAPLGMMGALQLSRPSSRIVRGVVLVLPSRPDCVKMYALLYALLEGLCRLGASHRVCTCYCPSLECWCLAAALDDLNYLSLPQLPGEFAWWLLAVLDVCKTCYCPSAQDSLWGVYRGYWMCARLVNSPAPKIVCGVFISSTGCVPDLLLLQLPRQFVWCFPAVLVDHPSEGLVIAQTLRRVCAVFVSSTG